MRDLITVSHVTKSYRSPLSPAIHALRGVSFSVGVGRIVALLGLNGAGKTTLTRILLGLARPDEGSIHIAADGRKFTGSGYLPEQFTPPGTMTAFDLLQYVGRLRGWRGIALKSLVELWLERFALMDAGKRRVATFSKGMRQRLGLAQALLCAPRLIVLDEPTEGLDPEARRMVRDLLLQTAAGGSTIWLTSHALSEVELYADEMVLLDRGTILRKGTLTALLPHDRFSVEIGVATKVPGFAFHPVRGGWACEVRGMESLRDLMRHLSENNIKLQELRPFRTNLEELFFSTIRESSDHGDRIL